MDENFIKLKRKYRRNALIKSAICGVSFGLLAVGICLLALKLSGIPFNIEYYVLIGVGAAVLCGAVMFLIFNPSNKKVAKRLDNEYKLEERAQTSLAFKDADGVIVELQRNDTATRLRSLPKLKLKFSKIWQYCTMVVLAVAVALTGVFIPAKEAQAIAPPIGSSDYPWRLSHLEVVKVRELISNVKSSHLDENVKTYVEDVLEGLLTDLEAATTLGVKDGLVYGAVDTVDGIITPLNYYESYARALEIMDQEYLSHAVTRGVIIYKSYKLTAYAHAQAFYNEQFELVGDAISGPIAVLRKEFKNDSELLATIGSNTLMLSAAINSVQSGDSEDDIYVALNWFLEQLENLGEQLSEIESKESDPDADIEEEDGESEGTSEWQNKLDSIFQSLSDRLSAALEVQAYNFAMNKFIGNRLKDIFVLPIDPDDDPLGEYDPEDPVKKDPDYNHVPDDGNIGGDFEFAAKDKIFEPSGSGSGLGGQYVTLKEVYYYYLGILQEMLMEGNLTAEQERIVRAYFDMLIGGFESEE